MAAAAGVSGLNKASDLAAEDTFDGRIESAMALMVKHLPQGTPGDERYRDVAGLEVDQLRL